MPAHAARALVKTLKEGISQKMFPGGAYAVGTTDTLWWGYAGCHTYSSDSTPIGPETLWDLASVTKVMATTPAAMLACEAGLLDLDQQVTHYLPQYRHSTTVRDLLLHSSGLPTYMDPTGMQGRDKVIEGLFDLELTYAPRTQSLYSCVGSVILQLVIESVLGQSLDRWLPSHLFHPLGLKDTLFNPDPILASRCAPTERIPEDRRRPFDPREFIQGEVHDPLAYAMGGVSGNAGLFSTAEDVGQYLQAMLCRGLGVIPASLISKWTRKQGPESTRGLGWDTKSPEESSAGSLFSATSYGHTGFTGTSVWIDPEIGIFAALLTNRIHPTREYGGIAAFRRQFHDRVYLTLTDDALYRKVNASSTSG